MIRAIMMTLTSLLIDKATLYLKMWYEKWQLRFEDLHGVDYITISALSLFADIYKNKYFEKSIYRSDIINN